MMWEAPVVLILCIVLAALAYWRGRMDSQSTLAASLQNNDANLYHSSRRPIIAVDFDGVIVKDRFPEIGPINYDVVWFLQYLADRDWFIIVWTCRGGKHLTAAKRFLAEHRIPYHAVNNHAPWQTPKAFGLTATDYGPAVKVTADLYLDDRGCRYAGSIAEALYAVREIEKRKEETA